MNQQNHPHKSPMAVERPSWESRLPLLCEKFSTDESAKDEAIKMARLADTASRFGELVIEILEGKFVEIGSGGAVDYRNARKLSLSNLASSSKLPKQ